MKGKLMFKDNYHHIKLSHFLSERIKASGKTQRQIAEEIGVPNSNVIAMLGSGTMKLPLQRVNALAKCLSIDPATLLKLTLRAYDPDILHTIENITGHLILDQQERELITKIREFNSNGKDLDVQIKSHSAIEINCL